jgi:hypothetical protein
LPPRAEHPVARFVHSSGAHYLQRDKRWAAEPIGGSGKPLRNVGCTLCCLSMALAEQGIDLRPPELNRALKQVDGFTAKGWLLWPAVTQVTGSRARAEIVWDPKLHDIDEALAAGDSVIVKVAPPPMIQHWVLLVGRSDREYLMKDPLDESRTVKPLSSLGSPILAVRVVKKAVPCFPGRTVSLNPEPRARNPSARSAAAQFNAEKNLPKRGSHHPGLSTEATTPTALPTMSSRRAMPK